MGSNLGKIFGILPPPGYEGLMERVAARLGVNLFTAQQRLGLRHTTVERMMGHCAACSDPGDCRRQLADRSLSEPPGYCPNRKMILALKADLEGGVTRPAPGKSKK
ncbi:DUF6455 family protein [Actibacterium sp. XHP0104]|uniref:DUF6455 family protein n=1 Tax=Actibacterium sp. XHP0104 TaxID=2984335 RepID=UPI0021E7B95D|nr:DUF6455 family protein [Actibacterium sp. XHP0104]MCV2881892.1 DUF6455 family protein [Actibacterium sp. XHP0104]